MLAYSRHYFPEGSLELAKDIVEIMHKSCPVENMLRMREARNDGSVVELFPWVACTTLIIHARGDTIHPLAQARKLVADIPNSELLILDSSNHVPMPGNADWDGFLKTVLELLNRP